MDSHLTHERPGELIEEFDREWAAGGTPRLEAYLARAPEADRSALFAELLAVELTRRMQRGEDPDRDDYLHRFPEYAAAVEGLLETRGAHPGDAPPTTRTLVLGPGGSGRDAGAGDTVRTPEVPPERVGRYRLERVLGRGGFGVVWLARDPELGRKVAVKVPRPDRPCPPEALENFLREARRAATLKVRGIVPVYDIGVEGGRFFIVSEYMEGGTLAERMRRGKMPPAEAARLIASVAETLHQAHLGNVVHRDIKPGNILLDARGEPYVGDLGLAVTEAELLREPGIPLGTYAYMSPEQFRGETDRIDPRSDVYSLGVVLYQLLTGRLPFLAEQPGEYETQTLRRDPRPPRTIDDTIPPELEQVCLRCLAKEVRDRYPTALDLANDLRAFLSRIPAAGAAPPPPAGARPGSRRRTLAAVALALALGLVLAGGIALRVYNYIIIPPAPPQLSDPFGWRQRIGAIPEELYWPGYCGQGEMGFKLDVRAFAIASEAPRLACLGKLDGRPCTISVRIRRPHWVGPSGIFVGYHEVEREGERRAVFQTIAFDQREDAAGRPILMAIRALTEVRPDTGVCVALQELGAEKVPFPTPGQAPRLELTLGPEGLTRARWGDQELPKLTGPFFNGKLTPEHYKGPWGLLNAFNTSWFSDPTFTLERKEDE